MARTIGGAAAGLVATAAMSAHMLSRSSADAIGTPPPRRIAEALLPAESASTRRVAAVVLHLAIGATGGAVYGGVRRHAGPVTGALHGMSIWVAGYEVLVPLLGVLPPAHRDSAARRAALLQAHLVYGSVLGLLLR
jgi:uncharacterized membrane protein YagU involved in acid resistance